MPPVSTLHILKTLSVTPQHCLSPAVPFFQTDPAVLRLVDQSYITCCHEVYVGRNIETDAGKGFTFMSFEAKANALKKLYKVHG